MYIGEIIKEYRTKNNLSQRAFAKRTSLSPSYINTLEKIYNPKTNKPYSVTTDVALEIANAMFINIEDLLSMLNKNEKSELSTLNNDFFASTVSSIPIISKLKAGYNYLEQENIIGMLDIPNDLANSGDFFALKVKEDSMAPTIIPDDFVIIKKQETFENGDIVVAIINENEVLIRKSKKSDVGILLQPFNPNYESLIFTTEEMKSIPIIIVGVVKRLERKF